MNSDTLLNSSPLLKKVKRSKVGGDKYDTSDKGWIDYAGPEPSKTESFKKKVRYVLNPLLRVANNYVFSLPDDWFSVLEKLASTKSASARKKYSQIKLEIEPHLSPKSHSEKRKIVIKLARKTGSYTDLMMWLEFYQVAKKLALSTENQVQVLKLLIFKYLIKYNVHNIPFMMILSSRSMSLANVARTHTQIQSKIQQRNYTRDISKPLLTIHIQGTEKPYILLWMDTENLCCFNVSQLRSPQGVSNFVNTLLLFINYALADTD